MERASAALRRAMEVIALFLLPCASLWGGATRPPSTAVLAALSGLALLLRLFIPERGRRSLRMTPLAIPVFALLVLTLAQLVPVPSSARAALNPTDSSLLRSVLHDLEPSTAWRPLTADPPATWNEAARLAGLLSLALAFGNLTWPRGRRWLRAGLLSAFAGVLGVAGVGALGVSLPESLAPREAVRLVALPFPNPDHVAALLAALEPLVLVLAVQSEGRRRIALVALAIAGNAVLFATLSRAGIILGIGGQLLTLWFAARREAHRGARAIGATLFVGIAVAAASVGGALAARMRLAPGGLMDEGRIRVAFETMTIVREHLLTGVGRGGFVSAFARCGSMAGRARFAFVENEYLQVLVDFGIVGALFVFAACVVAWRTARPHDRTSLSTVAARIGLAVLALHNGVDFSWRAGAVAAAGCALGLFAFPRRGLPLRPPFAMTFAVAALGLSALSGSSRGRSVDDDVAVLRSVPPSAFEAAAEAAFRRHPFEGFLADVAAARLLDERDPAAMRWLDRALILAPLDPAAHRLAARALALGGHREQAAAELRMAYGADRDGEALCSAALALFPVENDGPLLSAALPNRPDVLHAMTDRLGLAGRWASVQLVAHKALVIQPDDAHSLRAVVSAGLARGGIGLQEEAATRLAQVDPSAASALLAARTLLRLGHPDRSEQVLASQASRARQPCVVEALARALLARGATSEARSAVEGALVDAVDLHDKAELHRVLASIEESSGRPHRAAFERREAARLDDR